MKNTIIIIFLLFSFHLNSQAQNGYLLGTYTGYELKHKWISDSSYIFYRINYSNCKAANASLVAGNIVTCMSDSCNFTGINNGWYALVDSNLPTPHPIKMPCSNFATQCDNPYQASNAISYKKTIFQYLVVLPEHCGKYRIAMESGGGQQVRYTMTNLVTGVNYPYVNFVYMHNEINNLDSSIHNTSCDIINTIPIYVIDGQPQSYSLAASDMNGDSLVYHFIQPKERSIYCHPFNLNTFYPLSNIPYLAPFTLAEPFSTGGSFYWDSTQAIMHFTPVGTQNPVVTLVIDEYHNGTWVGNSWHDIPIVVLPANGITVNNSPVPASFSNATLQGNDTIYACVGKPLQYCYQLYSNVNSAALDTLSGICNINTKIPNANISYQNLYTDTINACVQWLPKYLTAVPPGSGLVSERGNM